MSTFEDMSEEAQRDPQMPEQPWFIHANFPLGPKTTANGDVRNAPKFDADKFRTPIENTWSHMNPASPPTWYPHGGAFVSRLNSGYRAGSTGFLDNSNSYSPFTNAKGQIKGWKVRLDPEHHRIFNKAQEFMDFLDKYPDKSGPKGYIGPNWDKIREAGVYSVEFPRSYWDSKDNKALPEPYGQLMASGNEPQTLIVDPRAVIEQAPWSMKAPSYREQQKSIDAMMRFRKKTLRSKPKQ